MTDYISREDVKKLEKEFCLELYHELFDHLDKDGEERPMTQEELLVFTYNKRFAQRLAAIPAADVRPVVQGCWAKQVVSCVVDGKRYPDYVEYRCSICGAGYVDIGYGYNFCPNCGADMRERVGEDE